MGEHEDIHIHRERNEDDEEAPRVVVQYPLPRYIREQTDKHTEFVSNEKEKPDPDFRPSLRAGTNRDDASAIQAHPRTTTWGGVADEHRGRDRGRLSRHGSP